LRQVIHFAGARRFGEVQVWSTLARFPSSDCF
jgi:hypothetical protein